MKEKIKQEAITEEQFKWLCKIFDEVEPLEKDHDKMWNKLNSLLIEFAEDIKQKTAEEIFDEIEAEEGMAIGGCGFVATKDILELKKKWVIK